MRQSSEPYVPELAMETLVLTSFPDVASMRSPIRYV